MESKADVYKKAGLGGDVGFGKRPAIIVVDFQKAFTHGDAPAGTDMSFQCKQTKKLTDAAREKNIKVFYSRVGFSKDGIDIGLWATKCCSNKLVLRDTWLYDWDENLDIRPEDVQFEKYRPSAFFGTHLAQMLKPLQIDTTIICGCTVAGCIYATVVDSCSNGYRTIIPKDAVFDRSHETYDMFLWNMGQKYGDISTVDECIEKINGLQKLEYEFLY